MKIELRETKLDGVIQITTLDERWYSKEVSKGVTVFNPSVSWICGYYPKGIGFYKWLADKGWDEAEAIKVAAGDRGSKVHRACEFLLLGNPVRMDDKFFDGNGVESELTVSEYECIMAFKDWWEDLIANHEVTLVSTEQTLWKNAEPGQQYGYAGTTDIELIVDNEPYIVDIKTSKQIWIEHELQQSAYKHAKPNNPKIAIIQIGYTMNKRGWKFTELEDKYDLFLHAKAIWESENPACKPKQKDYPAELKLSQIKAAKKPKVKKATVSRKIKTPKK